MYKKIIYPVRLLLGIILIIIGIISGFIPIIQGWIFILAGLLLIGVKKETIIKKYKKFRKWIKDKLKRKS